jgi:endonuclease III
MARNVTSCTASGEETRPATAVSPERLAEIFRRLRAANPAPRTELVYATPFELLIAVILSAQATDKSVNLATATLFKTANTPAALLKLGRRKLEGHIKRIGLYRTKAKNIIATCGLLVAKHGGEVPRTREDLQALPGVGRKTANVLRSVAMGLPGLPVDTHVGRLAIRLGLTTHTDPVKAELALNPMVPASERGAFSLRLILHGRAVCVARRPRCGDCVLADFCPSAGRV